MSIFRRQPDPRPLPPPSQPREVVHAPAPQPVQPTLHPAQVRRIDWGQEAQGRPQPPAQRTTYISAASDILPAPTINVANPNVGLTAEITPASTVEARTLGSHNDRARAWIRYSVPLCVAFAIVTTAAAIALYRLPLLSWSAFITFWLAFVVSYTLLLLRYWQHTPEGVALLHTRYLWGHLRREQAHRQQIERQMFDDQRERNQRRGGGR
jgi:hypothetical protein